MSSSRSAEATSRRFCMMCRKLARRLYDSGWAPEKLNPRVTSLASGAITAAALRGSSLVVMGHPTLPLTADEIAGLHAFVAEVCHRALADKKHHNQCWSASNY